MALTWSILVASHITRTTKLTRLVGMLAPQLTDSVEVVVLWNRGGREIGGYRQSLLENAAGDYVSFVDDDDRVPDFYCDRVLEALQSEPDYVGFEVAVADMSENPINRRWRSYRAIHSLRYDRWHQDRRTFFRDVSHLNPIRRNLALLVPFEGARGEDHLWAQKVRPHVRSEVFVDEVMYFYDFDQGGSVQGGRRDETLVDRPVLPAGFRFHPESDL